MLAIIAGLLLVVIALLAFALQRFYSSLPAKELKRLAARDEPLARTLYRPVAYGTSLRVLLWLIVGLCMPAGFLLLARNMSAWAALLIMIITLTTGLIWVPALELNVRRARLTVKAAPVLEWVLHYTHPYLDRVANFINNHRILATHSKLYEKEDLQALLNQQQKQADNRIDPADIDLMQRALAFKDTKVVNIIAPRSTLRLVSTSDALGPILMDELYKSKQQYFAVYRGQQDNIVGILDIKDVSDSKTGGHVSDVMRSDVCFVNEDFSLPQAIRAFTETRQQVALVINKFEECIGIINFNGMIDSLFDPDNNQSTENIPYNDRTAVAAFDPRSVAIEEPQETPTVETSPEQSEVVE